MRGRIESGDGFSAQVQETGNFLERAHASGSVESLSAISHQDLHLSDRQVLDVFVLGASVLDVSLAAKADWLVLFFETHQCAGRSECAAFAARGLRPLGSTAPSPQSRVCKSIVVLGAEEKKRHL